jgi:hypothetical protein
MSLYAGDMSSRIMGGEKLEDVLKNPYSKNVDLSKEQVLAIALNDYRASLPKPDNVDMTKPVDFGTVNQVHSPFGGKLPIVKPTTDEVKKQNLLVGDTDILTAEDKFYEKLGIKYHNTNMFGVASRMKGRFYLAVVLVAGYFAYKKFKK